MHRYQLAACIVLLAIGAIACGLLREPSDRVIDGWPVGSEVRCGVDADCVLLLGLAREHLDRRDPRHGDVIRASLHQEGTLVDPGTGDHILMTRSGVMMVAVLELQGDAVTAVGVGYPGISREPIVFDQGP